MRGAMLSILHRFVQHDTWTKISMENGAKSDRLAAAARALSHRPAGRPPFARAAHLALSRKLKGAEREGGREGKKARKVAACCCLMRPRELGAALSSRGQSGSVRQLLTNYVAACLSTVHFPACGWHRNRRKLDGRGEIEKVRSENMEDGWSQ